MPHCLATPLEDRCPPVTERFNRQCRPSLRPHASDKEPARNPARALRPNHVRQALLEEVSQPLRMERHPAAIHEALNAVLLNLRRVEPFQLAGPAGRPRCRLNLICPGIEHSIQRHVCISGTQQLCARVEVLNDALNNLELASTGPIGLVNDDHIRELDLIDQEVSDTPLVVLDRTDVAVGEPIASRTRAGLSGHRRQSPSCRDRPHHRARSRLRREKRTSSRPASAH